MSQGTLGHRRQSMLTMISYGFGFLFTEFIGMSFGYYVFYFYEIEIGIDVRLAWWGFLIYGVWRILFSPYIGYLTNRNKRLFTRFGRRTPWIVIGVIPMLIAYVLIYTPPIITNQGLIFGWLVFTTCLYSTFFSVWQVNMRAIFPDKFRDDQERRNASAIASFFGIVGVSLGTLIPPRFTDPGIFDSYMFQGLIVGGTGVVCLFLMLYGMREDRVMIEKYTMMSQQKQRSNFFRVMGNAFRQRNFVVFLVFFLMFEILTNSITESIPYIVHFILGDLDLQIYITASFFIGSLVSIPLWILFSYLLKNNAMTIIISGFGAMATCIVFQFINLFEIYMVFYALLGFFVGNIGMMVLPVFSDVIDELVVVNREREEGSYMGVLLFVGRLAIFLHFLISRAVQIITGFNMGYLPVPPPKALLGIRLLSGLIPAIFILVGTILFWIFYDLKPAKVRQIQEQMALQNL